jgi:iron(III) transport system substrate-binding protein
MRVVLAAATALAIAAAVLAGCGGGANEIVVYSGREEEIVEPLIAAFEQSSGIDVRVRYGDSAELAATIAEEGDASPADVFFAQDAGSLGGVSSRLAVLPQVTLAKVPAPFRDPEGHWVGTSGRVRVVAFNPEMISEDALPDRLLDYADPRFKGRIGIAPANASFQASVTALRLAVGDPRARKWLEDIKALEPKKYERNLQIAEAVARGEIALGLVNHYYLFLVKGETPNAPIANHFLAPGDPGGLVNAAGVGIVTTSDHAAEAQAFIDYLLSREGQLFYTERAEEAEYPLVAGVAARSELPALATLKGPDVPLDALGPELERTLRMLAEVGLT